MQLFSWPLFNRFTKPNFPAEITAVKVDSAENKWSSPSSCSVWSFISHAIGMKMQKHKINLLDFFFHKNFLLHSVAPQSASTLFPENNEHPHTCEHTHTPQCDAFLYYLISRWWRNLLTFWLAQLRHYAEGSLHSMHCGLPGTSWFFPLQRARKKKNKPKIYWAPPEPSYVVCGFLQLDEPHVIHAWVTQIVTKK